MLAAEGVVVLRCDPRSATGRGAVSAWTAYRQLGVKELEDITDIVESMKKRRWVDADRIGMSGYSYGGFMTAYAMTHSKLFAAGLCSSAEATNCRIPGCLLHCGCRVGEVPRGPELCHRLWGPAWAPHPL